MQQQNATLTDDAQRRLAGQQSQQGDDTVESLRRQVRLLEDKLRKTRTAERPFDETRVNHLFCILILRSNLLLG